MLRQIFKYAFLLSFLLLVAACSATRRVPSGSYMLTKNIIEEDKSVHKKERIRNDDIEKFVQPKPNRRFLGTNLYLQLYNTASPDTTKKNWWNRTLRKLGDPPVLIDSMLVMQSTDFIHNYAVYAGFYDSEVTFRVDTAKRRRATVTYTLEQNEPYRIGEIKYDFKDEFLRPIIMQDSANTLLRTGDILDGNVLNDEKVRITEYLKNNGYYDFNLNNIVFIGDSTRQAKTADITVEFRQYLAGHTQQGAPIYENNSIYRISKLIVNPNYDPMRMATDQSYYLSLDTIDYRGLHILYPRGSKPNVRPRILRQAVSLYPNYIYSTEETQQAYSNIMRLGYYKNASIVFEQIDPDGDEEDNVVTFIGGDEDEEASGQITKEKYLSAHINCVPALRQSYKVEVEGTTSSNFNAISATLGYQNRNLFRGVELFDISIKGGYEFLRVKGKKGSFEFGGATSMSFPRFIFPFKLDRYNKSVNPRTKVELSINSQRRPFYNRVLSSVNWGYSWSNRGRSSFTIRPIDVNLVKLNNLDTTSTFYKNIHSEYLRKSYEDQLVAGISGSYTFNSRMGNKALSDKSFLFRLNWETAGNFINLMSRAFDDSMRSEDGEKYYKLFGIRYAQYFRIDASISNRIMLGSVANFAFRFYGGVGKAYSNASTIPFDRFFYAGGSNSMRGWVPRTLGPGNQYVDEETIKYPNQVGNVKLEANAELRFPIWDMLHGALFFDLGNLWYLEEETSNKESVFKFSRFYRQLGLNTGLGIRFDIGMAVIRFDWGLKLHNPNEAKGRRWGHTFPLSNTVLNFGVGYPF